MFVTKNQFYVFLACLAFGAITGFVLSFFTCGVKLTRNKILENLTALIVLSLLGLIFTAYMFFMNFPNFRPYMLIGVFAGILGYFKSFHIILAKFVKKFYNIIHKLKKGIRKCQKQKQKD